MIYLKLWVIFPFCFPGSLFPFLSSRILVPSPPSFQSHGSLLPTPPPTHTHAHLHSHGFLVQASAVHFKTPANRPHPSPSLSFMLQREWFFFKGFNEMMAFHFLEDEIQPPKPDVRYIHRGQELTPIVLFALSFPGRHCPSSLPGKLILIFLVTSPLRTTSLP